MLHITSVEIKGIKVSYDLENDKIIQKFSTLENGVFYKVYGIGIGSFGGTVGTIAKLTDKEYANKYSMESINKYLCGKEGKHMKVLFEKHIQIGGM